MLENSGYWKRLYLLDLNSNLPLSRTLSSDCGRIRWQNSNCVSETCVAV